MGWQAMASYGRASDCKASQVKARPEGGNRKGNTLLLRRLQVATLLCFALGIRKTVGNREDGGENVGDYDVDGGCDDDGTDDDDNNDRGDDGVVDKTSHGVDDRSSKKATSATQTQNMQT